MRKRDNFGAINELRKMLGNTKKLTLEGYIMPDSNREYEDEPMPSEEEPYSEPESNVFGIEKELTQIRKIALNAINRLADKPTSPQYDTMKKIWNMVDRAIESKTSNIPND